MAIRPGYSFFSSSHRASKFFLWFAEVSIMVSTSKLSSIWPTVWTRIPQRYFSTRSRISSSVPQAGGQAQVRFHWPQVLASHISRTSGLNSRVFKSSLPQAVKPKSSASLPSFSISGIMVTSFPLDSIKEISGLQDGAPVRPGKGRKPLSCPWLYGRIIYYRIRSKKG